MFTLVLLVTELTLDLEQAEEKSQQSRTEGFVLKGRLGVLTDELERLKLETDNKIPVAVHTASVNECKRYSSVNILDLTKYKVSVPTDRPYVFFPVYINLYSFQRCCCVDLKLLDRCCSNMHKVFFLKSSSGGLI